MGYIGVSEYFVDFYEKLSKVYYGRVALWEIEFGLEFGGGVRVFIGGLMWIIETWKVDLLGSICESVSVLGVG